MTLEEAKKIVAEYQLWRRGAGRYAWNKETRSVSEFPYSPFTLGLALDTLLAAVEEITDRVITKGETRTGRFEGRGVECLA
jgi:hypothetical protein